MILITGATGHLGAATVDFLLRTVPATSIAALVRDEQKAATLSAKGVHVRVGDYHNKISLVKAFEGVEKLMLISSNDFDDRLGQHKRVIDAAKEAGVRHVVYTSASIKDIENSPLKTILGDHFDTEKYLQQSGLAFTILRNSLYAEMIPVYTGPRVFETGILLPAGDGRVAFASRMEMAEAAANVLSQAIHDNKIYEITNAESYSYVDVAAMLSELSGKPVSYTSITADEFTSALKQAGVPEPMIGLALGFSLATANGDFENTDTALEQLIGRKPASLRLLLKELFGL